MPHTTPMKDDKIFLSHGAGGKQSRTLVEKIILKYFNDPLLVALPDSATFDILDSRKTFCFTTDSYVVNPVFFPGGDIGKLAVCGTVNDLAVCGAKPLFISCAMIIEEGFSINDFERILRSMATTARKVGVRIVTGDTKVVDRGKCDGIFITTSGIGIKKNNVCSGLSSIRPGDAIILSGVPGLHELSIICAREHFNFTVSLKSDCAPIYFLVEKMLGSSARIKFMRDPTRGGVASVLNEIVAGNNFGIRIYEEKIPLTEQVRSLCDIFGFEILHLASEGRVVMVVDKNDAQKLLDVMKKHPLGKRAEIIGNVIREFPGRVILKTKFGSERFVEMPSGKQLPRIC
ncbi:MAG TPA: hydrogenase expression/formation protein HypE [bacterium]|nr:hydrogenase expression/formation protein HypE [bacterium]HOL49708.1 hydrogenase expression/formation protein HypE [bacterium]HPO52402.1 hydrogenase expression/formation protein HypE [bacterium]